MATLTLKGKVGAIGNPAEMGDSKTLVQYMILLIPGYVDGFGDKKGKDQQWALQVVGEKKISELKMVHEELLDKKVECKVYADSFCLLPKEAGKDPFYVVNCTLASFVVIP